MNKLAQRERVLVTGSSGRLGQAVVADLAARGYDVVGADRTGPHRRASYRHLSWDGRDVAVLVEGMQGCEGLVHLAAIPGPRDHPAEVVFTNNTGATFAALEAAAQVGVRRVALASSGSAYGTAWSPRPTHVHYVPVDEQHPLLNFDPYGLSKEVDERTAEMFCRRAEMSVAALRFHWIATPDEQFLRVAELAGNEDWPEQLRELWGYVDLRDAARACRLALEAARERPYGFAPLNIVAADTDRDLDQRPGCTACAGHRDPVRPACGSRRVRHRPGP